MKDFQDAVTVLSPIIAKFTPVIGGFAVVTLFIHIIRK